MSVHTAATTMVIITRTTIIMQSLSISLCIAMVFHCFHLYCLRVFWLLYFTMTRQVHFTTFGFSSKVPWRRKFFKKKIENNTLVCEKLTARARARGVRTRKNSTICTITTSLCGLYSKLENDQLFGRIHRCIETRVLVFPVDVMRPCSLSSHICEHTWQFLHIWRI